jgi:hypothetical protein
MVGTEYPTAEQYEALQKWIERGRDGAFQLDPFLVNRLIHRVRTRRGLSYGEALVWVMAHSPEEVVTLCAMEALEGEL